jgi:hypothetical protein
VPFGASVLALLILLVAMFNEQRIELVGQRNAASSGRRLDLHFDKAATVAFRAPASVACAVWRTWWRARALMPPTILWAGFHLVISGTAGVRVGAACFRRRVIPCTRWAGTPFDSVLTPPLLSAWTLPVLLLVMAAHDPFRA